MNKIIGVFIILSCSAFTTAHKFYSSISQIIYDETKQTLQITSRYTMEDLELVLQKRYDTTITIDPKKSSEPWEAYLKQYFEEKFTLHIDTKKISYSYSGVTYEDDLLLCHFEAVNIDDFERIQISNTVLMDLFETQQNIIHVKKGKQRKTLILEKENHNGILKFNK